MRKLLLLLPLLLLLFGCSKDVFEEPIKNETRFVAKKVSLKNVNDPKLNKAVQELKQNRDQFAGKIVYDSIYNFYYDDADGLYLESGSTHSYCFPIYRDDMDEKIEKLLFQYKSTGEYKTYIVKYDFTPEELETRPKEELEAEEIVYTDISTNKCDATMALVCTEFFGYVEIEEYEGVMDGDPTDASQTLVHITSDCTFVYNSGNLNEEDCGGGGDSEFLSSPYVFGGGTLSPYGDYSSMQIRFLRDLGLYGQNSFTQLGINTQNAVFDYIHSYNYTGYLYTRAVNVIKALMSNPQHSDFLISQSQFTQSQIFNYLIQNAFNLGSQTFITQCITQMETNPDVFTNITPFLIEKYIDDSELDPCTKAIVESIKNLQGNDFAKIMAKLNSPLILKPDYHTKIQIGQANPNALATTNWVAIPNPYSPQPGVAVISPFNYQTNISPSFLDGTLLSYSNPPQKPTKLSIARTVIHELIHAYFDSLYDDCYFNNNCTEIKSFEELYTDYEHWVAGTNNLTDAHHNVIASDFVNIIAVALQEYDTGTPVNNVNQIEQVYKDLAWFGLGPTASNPNGTPAYSNLSYEEKDRITKVNTAENTSTPQYNQSGVLTYFPQNTPCD